MIDRCRKLARFTEQPGITTRTFLSAPMRDCHREIALWLDPLGAEMKIDAAGNLRAIYPAAKVAAPRLMIGSHLDTVPNAGAFDGILGVILGVALLEALDGERLPFAIEIVGFSEEEGVRFGRPFIGSRALVGTLDRDLLGLKDDRGTSLCEAIENFGLKPAEIPAARLDSNVFAFVEFHIEQGPILESLNLPLAVVDAIAGQSKLEFTFRGRANHAGTTPMSQRHDALAGAAEWVTAVEREARSIPALVATVGAFKPNPGVPNVIAGEAHVSLDVRHASDDVRLHVVESLVRAAKDICGRRGLSMSYNTTFNQVSVPMDPFLVEQIDEAIRRTGCRLHHMASGAGHDAMILAGEVPTGMIFVRTPGGVSHNPEETVQIEDVAKSLEAGAHLLSLLACSPAVQRRIQRA